ncbi:MAG: carboxypeptidase-like regulatory domain-containing protein, partial [Planctomycetota bacterium]
GLRQMQADILSAKPVTLWVVETNEKVLTGNVCDVTGSPVSGVRITADSEMDIAQGRLRAYTDENGFFQIANLFPGKWVISAMIPNGPALQRTIDIPMDTNPSPLTIRIENTCSIEGEILTDQEPGRMSIRVQGLDFETEAQKIGSKLWYSFQHLPPGRAQLILEVYDGRRYQECYLSVEEVWVDLEKGKVLRHDFSL